MSEHPLPPVMSTDELEKMGHTIISLAKEVWVLHDRQRIMEARLIELGLDLQLDSYSPPPELTSVLNVEREEFVSQLIDSLAGREQDDDLPAADDSADDR